MHGDAQSSRHKNFIFVDFEFSEVKRVLIYIEKCSINICMKNPTKGIE